MRHVPRCSSLKPRAGIRVCTTLHEVDVISSPQKRESESHPVRNQKQRQNSLSGKILRRTTFSEQILYRVDFFFGKQATICVMPPMLKNVTRLRKPFKE